MAFRLRRVVVFATAQLLLAVAGSGQPLSLAEALRTACSQNPRISSANAAARAASADFSLAKSALRPHVSAGIGYTYLSLPTTFFGQEIFKQTTQAQSLTLSMNVLAPSLSGVRKAAGLRSAAEASMAQEARDRILLEVAGRYWEAAAATQSIAAARDGKAFLEANLASVRKMQESGLATRGDVLRAEAELALANDRLLRAANTGQIALAALKFAMGARQSQDISVASEALAPDNTVALVAEHESGRVIAARSALKSAEAAVRAARAQRLPSVSVDADVQAIAQGAEFPRRDGSAAVMIRAGLPLWEGGSISAAVDKAVAQRDQAASELQSAEDQVSFERETTRLSLESARERWRATEKQVESATESRRLIEIGVREGVNTQTDLLSAQASVSAAQASRIQSLTDLKTAEAAWLAAIGRIDVLMQSERE
ncbi:MAG: TolC family protein [Armatimonadetes bacterium]|nr:TolC family protein [Armatimonadota bacterium]